MTTCLPYSLIGSGGVNTLPIFFLNTVNQLVYCIVRCCQRMRLATNLKGVENERNHKIPCYLGVFRSNFHCSFAIESLDLNNQSPDS